MLVVARAIARAVAALDPALLLVGLAGSQLIAAGQAAGLAVLNEAFADRRYQTNGQLVSRETSGALIVDPRLAAAQAAALAHGEAIDTLNGGRIRVRADTICLHGDTPGRIKYCARRPCRAKSRIIAHLRFLQPDHAAYLLLTASNWPMATTRCWTAHLWWSMRASASA